MLDPFAMLLLDRQHQAVLPLHIAVAAAGIIGHGARCCAFQGLGIDLLVLFVDEQQPIAAQAKAATAVFVNPATHTEAIGGQAAGLLVLPVPDATGTIGRAKLVPEQPRGADLEFGEVGAGGNCLDRAELSRGR